MRKFGLSLLALFLGVCFLAGFCVMVLYGLLALIYAPAHELQRLGRENKNERMRQAAQAIHEREKKRRENTIKI